MRTTNLKIFLFILSFCFPGSFLYSQNECVNGVSLYQKTFGGTKDEFVNYSAPAADSGYVIAGQTNSFGNGGYDGLVIKVDKKGNVVWSKALGGSSEDKFSQIKLTSDNGFIVCGTTKSYGSSGGEAWLVKLDASGNVQWSKKYGDGTTDGQLASDVIQLSDGGYAFCGVHRWLGGGGGVAQSLVVRTDAQGNVLWSKQYTVSSASDDAAGILEDGNSLVVTGYFNGSSFMDGYIMMLDKFNGQVQWLKRYDADNRSTWFSKVAKTHFGYQVHSVITDNFGSQNQQVCIWNLDNGGAFQSAKKISTLQSWNISAAWHPFADRGFLVATGENTTESDVTLTRVNADGSIRWSRKYQRTGRQQLNSIAPTALGGYVAVGNNNNFGIAVDGSDAYVLRVDSMGEAGTCSGINSNEIVTVSPFVNLSSTGTAVSANVTFVNPVIIANSIDFVSLTNTQCLYCQLPTDNTCVNGFSLYQKTYGGIKEDVGVSSAPTADSGFVIAGKTNGFGSGGYDGMVMKINKTGNVVWSKTFGGTANDELNAIRTTGDSGFIACGTTRSFGNTAGRAWLIKLDASGNLQWSKKYGDGTGEGDIGSDVVALSDGGYALCGIYRWGGGAGNIAQSFVMRTDGLGNVIWSKQYTVGAASDDASGIIEDGNSLVVTGYYNGGSSFMDGYIMKLDKSNGAIQWIKRYDAENRSTWFGKAAKTNTGYQVIAAITDNFSSQNQQLSIWNLNADGTFQNIRKLVIPGIWSISAGWRAFDDGGFIIANGENNNNSDVIVSKVNANGSIAWSKKFQRPGKQQVNSILSSFDNGYVAIGTNNNAGTIADSTNVFVMRLDSLGDAGSCSGVNTTDVTVTTPFFTSPAGSVAQADVSILNPVLTVAAVNFVAANNTMCFNCVSSPPDVPVVVATANAICVGANTILNIESGSLNGATSWKWYTGSCGGTLVGSGFAIIVSPAVTTTYYVRGEGAPSGPGNCGSITITVNNPTSPTFILIPPLCQNSIAPDLQTISSNGITGSWSPAIINTTVPGSANYIFTPDSNQCAISSIMSIVIIPLDTAAITPIGPLCKNSFAPPLPTTSNNNITGSWSPATINTSIAGTATYIFTPDSGQCAGVITMDIIITNNQPVITYCPAPDTLCYNSSDQYSIEQLIATSDCGSVSTSFSITGATTRTGTGNNASGIFNPGTSTITWTVTDAQGNTANCTTTIVVDKIDVTIPDAKALNYSGILYNTVYPAYGPASSITLTAQASGGSGPYIYSWSNGETTPSITVSPTSTTVYTVTVTGNNGCQVTASKEITVQNINCNYHKVYMCHVTGNPDHVVEICIDDDAVPAHLAAGCSLGECPGNRTSSSIVQSEAVDFKIRIVPIPSDNYFRLILNTNDNSPISIRIIDVLGRVVEVRKNIGSGENLIFGNRLRPGAYMAEITQGANRKVIKLIKM